MSSKHLGERLEARRDSMPPAVLRVACYLADHPERALVATAAELADLADTSDATVIRAVQLLGYAGLPELRREVGAQLVARHSPIETLEMRVAQIRDDPRSVLDTVIDDAIKVLAETRRTVDHDQFLNSVRLLNSADRIIVMGWGPAGTVADLAALSLARIGYPATAETHSGFRLADGLAALREGDVILLLAPLMHVQEIDVTLTRIASVGAHCVLITEILGERHGSHVDYVLTTASSRHGAAAEIVGIVALVDALVLGLNASRPEQARTKWTAITELRGQLTKGKI